MCQCSKSCVTGDLTCSRVPITEIRRNVTCFFFVCVQVYSKHAKKKIIIKNKCKDRIEQQGDESSSHCFIPDLLLSPELLKTARSRVKTLTRTLTCVHSSYYAKTFFESVAIIIMMIIIFIIIIIYHSEWIFQ